MLRGCALNMNEFFYPYIPLKLPQFFNMYISAPWLPPTHSSESPNFCLLLLILETSQLSSVIPSHKDRFLHFWTVKPWEQMLPASEIEEELGDKTWGQHSSLKWTP